MKVTAYIFLFTCLLVTACQDATQTTVTVIDTVSETVEQEEMEPPPVNAENFVSMSDWLGKIIAAKQPDPQVRAYVIGLFTSGNQQTIFLKGLRKSELSGNGETSAPDFIPEHAYAKLPEAYTKGMDQTGLLEKLQTELVAYTQTADFQQSYLAKADALVLETNGKVIWKK
ncbi:MAG: hypothetical protein ACK4RX_09630 [Chitinophagaceae bacterium]